MRGPAQAFAVLMFACGFRPQELLGLKRDCWDGERLHICQKVTRRKLEDGTKTDNGRWVYVPTWARPFLEQQLARHPHDYVSVNQYGEWHKKHQWFAVEWREAHTELGIAYRHPYVARHTRAAELLSQGEEAAEAAKQLGHSVQMFLNTYSEWIDEYAKRDYSKLEGVGLGLPAATENCQNIVKFPVNRRGGKS